MEKNFLFSYLSIFKVKISISALFVNKLAPSNHFLTGHGPVASSLATALFLEMACTRNDIFYQ
jgi:hypothetical protein